MSNSISLDLYKKFLDSLLAGDRKKCLKTVSNIMDEGIPIKIIYEDLLKYYKTLYYPDLNSIEIFIKNLK